MVTINWKVFHLTKGLYNKKQYKCCESDDPLLINRMKERHDFFARFTVKALVVAINC